MHYKLHFFLIIPCCWRFDRFKNIPEILELVEGEISYLRLEMARIRIFSNSLHFLKIFVEPGRQKTQTIYIQIYNLKLWHYTAKVMRETLNQSSLQRVLFLNRVNDTSHGRTLNKGHFWLVHSPYYQNLELVRTASVMTCQQIYY